MSNFLRVIRLSLRYRMTVIGVIVCSMAVGLLWGTNIGTVFPFVEVVFRGKSLHDWVDTEIAKSEETVQQLEHQIWQRRAAGGDKPTARLESRLQAEHAALATYRHLQPYIHGYLPRSPFSTLILIVAILFFGTLVKDLFLAVSTMLTERLAQSGTIQLRKRLYNKTLRMQLQMLQRDNSNQLMSRLTYDLDQITQGLRILFGRTLREPLKMAACLIGAAAICSRLLLLSMILAPVAVYAISILNSSLKRANAKALSEMSSIYSVLGETLRGMRIVKAYTMESAERRRFDTAARRYYGRAMRVAMYDAMVRPSIEMMGIGIICIAILGGAYLVLNEETHLLGLRISQRPLSISAIMLFFGFLAGTSDPARKLSGVIGRLQRAAAAADRVYELIDQASELKRPERPFSCAPHRRDLRFENVSFAYMDGPRVLDDVNLTIEFGETIALVGPNGCGKSTLASLVLRFFDPTEGMVRLDGVDIREMRLRELRRQIGLVTQDALLFNDTVAANIRFGHPTASQQQVVAAAEQAHAHAFITQQLSRGYDTYVGEGACRLSGGQKQRIALARAILKDPRILILDEATSQVDLESEQQIHAILSAFTRGRTTIIITHRPSLLELADRIVVMQQGRILDTGPYAELVVRSEAFKRLSMQSPSAPPQSIQPLAQRSA